MDTKKIALIVGFASLSIVLNPAISHVGFAFPPLPTLFLNVWEIPVITLFLLIGIMPGITVAAINALFLFSVYPGPSNPFLAIGSILSATSMMIAIYLNLRFRKENEPQKLLSGKAIIIYATLSSVVLRVLVMAPVGYAVAKVTVASLSDKAIFMYVLPWQAAYNVIQPFITIPIAFLIARQINKSLNVRNATV
jgi:riboflavin transporter FmnP